MRCRELSPGERRLISVMEASGNRRGLVLSGSRSRRRRRCGNRSEPSAVAAEDPLLDLATRANAVPPAQAPPPLRRHGDAYLSPLIKYINKSLSTRERPGRHPEPTRNQRGGAKEGPRNRPGGRLMELQRERDRTSKKSEGSRARDGARTMC